MVVPGIGVILSQIFKPDGQIAEPNKTKSSMNDLAKMRADFEKKIKLAEKENFFEEKYGVNFYVFDLQTEPEKIRVHVSENYATVEVAKRLLEDFPAEGLMVLNASAISAGDIYYKYRIGAKRGYSDRCSIMEIEWQNGGNQYGINLKIEETPLLHAFFNHSFRQVSDSELSTYHPTDAHGRLNRDCKIPCVNFPTTQINYSGGYRNCTDTGTIDEIINAILNS